MFQGNSLTRELFRLRGPLSDARLAATRRVGAGGSASTRGANDLRWKPPSPLSKSCRRLPFIRREASRLAV